MVTKASVATIRFEFEQLRESYSQVANSVRGTLIRRLKKEGLQADIQHRVKDVDSLVKKIYKRKYSSLDEVTDLAGVRVIVPTLIDHKNICSIIEAAFGNAMIQDKSRELGDSLLGYRGVHFQVHPKSRRTDISRFSCEIQVRTRAEHLWNDFSHELFYKSDLVLPEGIQRPFQRLVALVEIFDQEVARTMEALKQHPGDYNLSLLNRLESLFRANRGESYDREMSLLLLHSLSVIIAPDPDSLIRELGVFAMREEDKLNELWNRESNYSQYNPFMLQPESILIWYLLSSRVHDTIAAWSESWDLELLEDMATQWGVPLPGYD